MPARGGGGWWWRFIAWAILLSIPGWLLADAYHSGLRAIASALLGVTLPRQPVGGVEVSATHVLGIYAALCLASTRAPLRRRLLAVGAGVPVLVGIELLTGMAALESQILLQTGHRLPRWTLDYLDQALTAPPWLGAPLLWLLFLGSWQMQGLRPRGGPGPSPSRPPGHAPAARSAARDRR